ncbi:MAG: hypothetical protein MZV70_68190 [Desulfobacterales bacterium]|nr:hypothetical protein [Desulfobacterales bacterium]
MIRNAGRIERVSRRAAGKPAIAMQEHERKPESIDEDGSDQKRLEAQVKRVSGGLGSVRSRRRRAAWPCGRIRCSKTVATIAAAMAGAGLDSQEGSGEHRAGSKRQPDPVSAEASAVCGQQGLAVRSGP